MRMTANKDIEINRSISNLMLSLRAFRVMTSVPLQPIQAANGVILPATVTIIPEQLQDFADGELRKNNEIFNLPGKSWGETGFRGRVYATIE